MSKNFQEKVKEAQKTYSKLQEVLSFDRTAWWEEAECWWDLKNKKLYKLVHGMDEMDLDKAWTTFVGEVGIPASTVRYKIGLYDFYIKRMGFNKKDMQKYNVRKLQKLKGAVNHKNDVETMLPYADKMSLSDFFDFIDSGEYKDELNNVD